MDVEDDRAADASALEEGGRLHLKHKVCESHSHTHTHTTIDTAGS